MMEFTVMMAKLSVVERTQRRWHFYGRTLASRREYRLQIAAVWCWHSHSLVHSSSPPIEILQPRPLNTRLAPDEHHVIINANAEPLFETYMRSLASNCLGRKPSLAAVRHSRKPPVFDKRFPLIVAVQTRFLFAPKLTRKERNVTGEDWRRGERRCGVGPGNWDQ
jgi:hypothetical protein